MTFNRIKHSSKTLLEGTQQLQNTAYHLHAASSTCKRKL